MATKDLSEKKSTIERTRNNRTERSDYWKKVVSHYEKRNASLERKQAALVERVRFMECALPSLLMGAVVGVKRDPESSKSKVSSCSHLNSEQNCGCSPSSNAFRKMNPMRLIESKEDDRKIEDMCRWSMQNGIKP